MTTDYVDSSEATSSEPLPTDTLDSNDHQEEQTEQDAAEETDEQKADKARQEAKMWEGRAKKAKEKLREKGSPLTEESLDWKFAYQSRVELVKESYEKELDELLATGAKLSSVLKTKALEYAESKILPKDNPSDNSLPSSTVDRSGKRSVKMSPTDQALGIKPETVEEFRDYVEGR